MPPFFIGRNLQRGGGSSFVMPENGKKSRGEIGKSLHDNWKFYTIDSLKFFSNLKKTGKRRNFSKNWSFFVFSAVKWENKFLIFR